MYLKSGVKHSLSASDVAKNWYVENCGQKVKGITKSVLLLVWTGVTTTLSEGLSVLI
jgi:hypothetical protein